MGHFNIIWPNVTPPTSKQDLPTVVKLDTMFRKTEHTIGLKIPLKGFTSNSMPFGNHLAPNAKNCILHAIKLAFPAKTMLETTNLQSEPMDGLKKLQTSSISNFRSNRQRLTQHQPKTNKTMPLGDRDHQSHYSSNKAHEWSQNTSNELHVKFQVISTSFYQILTPIS